MADVRLEGTRIEELEAQPSLAVRVQQKMADLDLAKAFDTYLPKVGARAEELGVSHAGAPYGRYHQFGPEIVDVEIGLPVETAPDGVVELAACESGEVGASELPAGLVARTTHLGPYDTLPQAYDTLHEWIHAQPGVDDGDAPWESYVDKPGDGDTSGLRTDIVWPLQKEG